MFSLIVTCSAKRFDRESFSSSIQPTVKHPADISTTRNNRKSKIQAENSNGKPPEAKAGFQIYSVSLWLTYSRSAVSGQCLGS